MPRWCRRRFFVSGGGTQELPAQVATWEVRISPHYESVRRHGPKPAVRRRTEKHTLLLSCPVHPESSQTEQREREHDRQETSATSKQVLPTRLP